MNKKQKKVLIRIIIAAVLMVPLMILDEKLPAYVIIPLFMVAYLVIGYDILLKAFKGITKGRVFDENFLMAIATVGAIALGEYSEGVAVMLFYQIGELFQSCAIGKSRKNISELMDIRPDYANVETEDGITRTDPDEVEIGTVIVVSPGEKVPIDGIVISGNSSLDMSALNGESIPRNVAEGQEVISGCVNLNGILRIQTTKEFGESTASKILELVENASSRKSRSENFISRFARVYTPAVCIGAFLLAICGPALRLVMGLDAQWGVWVYRALTFLVISCPCALVISIPLTFFAGIGGAGRAGVLVKGSNYLELLSKTKYVAFDKTGTITKGIFAVTEIGEKNGYSKDDVLKYAAFGECYSSHPISVSLRKAYESNTGNEVKASEVTDVNEVGGHGIEAKVIGKNILVGNGKLLDSHGIKYDNPAKVGTIVHLVIDGEYAGYIVISDQIKETSQNAISGLYKQGVKDTIMLTGDHTLVGESVAKQLSIGQVYCELLPADKVEKVEQLIASKKESEVLAFVGDGINDAPVLSRADVGIAMGALGSDAAIEAADVVLMDDNPEKIVSAIRIAKKCIRIVYENIYFALGVKLVCLLLGAIGIANMWTAIFADVGVMVLAVLNAIRALKVDK